MAKLLLFIAVLCISLQFFGVNSAGVCNERRNGHDSIYCVCNSTSCDTMDPLIRTDAGVVQIFESTRAGKRLNYRESRFNGNVKSRAANKGSFEVTVDRSQTFQGIMGFGGAFSDAAAIGIGRMGPTLQRSILSEYYSENGIEYNMGRSVISGCDFSNRPYTYDDTPNDFDLTSWALTEEDTLYKIPQMKQAQELSSKKIKYFASSWSPPAWMKTNNALTGGGGLIGNAGTLYWQTYARYLLKYFDTYKANGIDWWGMTVQNEPMTGWDPWFPWNTCAFNAQMERDFVKLDLGPILEAGGYGGTTSNFSILFLDHNLSLVNDWADTVLADPVAARYLTGLALHWYGKQNDPYEWIDDYHRKHPNHYILATEACNRGEENDRVALGNWFLGEEYALDIMSDLLHWVAGWVDWNLVVDMEGGPNWVRNFHSAPIVVNPEAGEFYKNTQYYAMGHFSKFLSEGTKRIGGTIDYPALKVATFLRPDGGVVVIAINAEDTDHTIAINDPLTGRTEIFVEPKSFNSWLYYN